MSPAAFSANLVKCTKNDWQLSDRALLSFLPWKLKLKVSLAKLYSLFSLDGVLALDVLSSELQKDPLTALQTILDAYLKLVKDAKQKRKKKSDPWPVIIIDEANRLTKWKDTESLEQLLAFFVYLTKQEQLAHVILATSDTFLTQWLESGAPCCELALRLFHVSLLSLCAGPIKDPFRTSFVVGNLTGEEARTYFFDYVLPSACKLPPGANEAWERVYEVCGGNPGLLGTCAFEVAKFSSWELGTQCAHLHCVCLASSALRNLACSQAVTPSCVPR